MPKVRSLPPVVLRPAGTGALLALRLFLLTGLLASAGLLSPATGQAADQVTSDPDDAYALGSQGQSDLRSVEWHTEGATVTAVVRIEASAASAAFVFLDVDRNGRADYALDVDGGSGTTFDAKVWPVPASTAACSLFEPQGGAVPVVSQQPAATTDGDGLRVLTVAFPASAIGGATSFAWAAFGLTFNGMNPPGWDYAPDAANPDPKVPQPADRSCSIDQTPGEGVAVDLSAAVVFPTPVAQNTPPQADFAFAPAAPLSGDPVTFTSGSTDAEGPLTSQRWDLDADGQYDDATGPTATRTYSRRGPAAVGLLVEDAAGDVATATHTVPVGNRPPVVVIQTPSDRVFPGQPAHLTSASTDDGAVASESWDLDDDGVFDDATGPLATATFATKGTKTVRLRVTDDDGTATEGSATVTIANRPPVAVLRLPVRRVPGGEAIQIDASGSTDPDGDRLRYYANVSGASTVESDDPVFTVYGYSEPGVRTVYLSVSDRDGSSAATTDTVETVLPRAPQPVITGPDQDAVVLGGTVEVSGRVEHKGNLVAACVTANDTAMPASCTRDAIVDVNTGRFTGVPVALRPGPNRVTAWARDRFGQVGSATVVYEAAGPESGLDLRASMIEITQGTQWASSSVLRDGTPGAARIADYHGVRLAHGGPTYARVFANARSLARGGTLPRGVLVTLEGYGRSGRLPGGPLLPISRPPTLDRGPTALAPSRAMRLDPRGAYTFVLPDRWTRETELRLDATVDPAGAFPECATCRRDNTHSLRGIGFVAPTPLTVNPVRIVPTTPPLRPASVDLDSLRRVYPGGDAAVTVLPYRDVLDIAGILDDPAIDPTQRAQRVILALAMLEGRAETPGATMGITNLGAAVRGMALPVPFANRVEWIAVADQTRPLTSIAHEFGHMQGLRHASTCTSNPASDPGGPLGVLAEGWPSDEQGRLQGYALDLRPHSAATGPFRVIGPEGYDFMSYCANTNGDTDSWLSPRNWNRRLGGPGDRPVLPGSDGASRRSTRASGPTLTVAAAIPGDGRGTIERVEPDTGAAPSAPPADAPFRIVVRGAGGAVLSDTPVAGHETIVEGATERLRLVMATVPAGDGAASVQLIPASGGAPLATRVASATAPVVTLSAPQRAGTELAVAWQASDADGDALRTRVEVAGADGAWRSVAVDVAGASVRVPLATLRGGTGSRVRVAVSDGFHETVAESSPVDLPAARASVEIVEPRSAARLPGDATVVLRSQAVSPAGKRLPVTWYAGRRRLGRGAVLTTRALPPGRVRLRAVADGGGSDSVRVRVMRAPPQLVALRAAASARSVTLRLAANQQATLRVRGRRFALGRTPRSVKIPVARRRGRVTLRLRLRAGRRTTVRVLRV